MTVRNDKVYLQDILEAINHIENYLADKSVFEFSADSMMQDAVIRRFEIIGEASSLVSTEFKAKHPQIEWQLMKDMRNKLIHEYCGLSSATIYATIKQSLPPPKEKITSALNK